MACRSRKRFTHFWRISVAKMIYALRSESFCAWNSADRKVFHFCVSGMQSWFFGKTPNAQWTWLFFANQLCANFCPFTWASGVSLKKKNNNKNAQFCIIIQHIFICVSISSTYPGELVSQSLLWRFQTLILVRGLCRPLLSLVYASNLCKLFPLRASQICDNYCTYSAHTVCTSQHNLLTNWFWEVSHRAMQCNVITLLEWTDSLWCTLHPAFTAKLWSSFVCLPWFGQPWPTLVKSANPQENSGFPSRGIGFPTHGKLSGHPFTGFITGKSTCEYMLLLQILTWRRQWW